MKCRSLTILVVLVTFLGGRGQLEAQQLDAKPYRVTAGSVTFEFASVESGREALGRPDTFTEQQSAFDRQVRMGTAEDPGVKAYLDFVRGEVIEWDDETRQQYTAAIESLEDAFQSIPLPPLSTIPLIRTTGNEESGAAYTRANVIVLPVGHGAPKDKLIAHELFHVISRNYPKLRDQLYSRIGFRRSGPITMPPDLAARKITNPDAPEMTHIIDVQFAEEKRAMLTPILYANQPFKPESNMTIFSNMEARLMEVLPSTENRFAVRLEDGKPVMHQLGTPDYLRQVGRNSRSIFHPEEILADNFSTLVVGRGTKVDPWIQEAIREEFEAFASTSSTR